MQNNKGTKELTKEKSNEQAMELSNNFNIQISG